MLVTPLTVVTALISLYPETARLKLGCELMGGDEYTG